MDYKQEPQMLTQIAPEDLFILMAYKDENPEQARLAYLEFYKKRAGSGGYTFVCFGNKNSRN